MTGSGLLPLAQLAIDREITIIAALIALIVAGLVLAWGALVFYRRERHMRTNRDGEASEP